MQNVGQEALKNLVVALPPVDEQAEITSMIMIKTRSLRLAIARFEDEIALLREYRTRLIADVVRGKLDVREAAANVPIEECSEVADEAADEDAEGLAEELTEAVN